MVMEVHRGFSLKFLSCCLHRGQSSSSNLSSSSFSILSTCCLSCNLAAAHSFPSKKSSSANSIPSSDGRSTLAKLENSNSDEYSSSNVCSDLRFSGENLSCVQKSSEKETRGLSQPSLEGVHSSSQASNGLSGSSIER